MAARKKTKAARRSAGRRRRKAKAPRSASKASTGVGPGLRKAGPMSLVLGRELSLFQVFDCRLRELLETADVMSEGAIHEEAAGLTYYGTTSILMFAQSDGGEIPDATINQIAELLRRNVHVRTRAVRIACREAQVRSKFPLSQVRAEFSVRRHPRGVQVDVEVEAPVQTETTAGRGVAR